MITLNSTDCTTDLNRAVCFFHMFDRLFFIMINECLTVSACGAGAITGFIPLLTVEATPLGHEDNRNCKRSAFICVNSIKKLS